MRITYCHDIDEYGNEILIPVEELEGDQDDEI